MRWTLRMGVLALALIPLRARASVALELSVEQLTQRADVVVRAHVGGQESSWTRGGRIVTTVHLAVDESLKGTAPGTIDVRHLGGHVGTIGQQVSGEVHFTPGEEVVVFLRAHPFIKGTFVVMGMSQGKFLIDRTGKAPLALQDLDGLGLVQSPGAPIAEKQAQPLPLDALRARVKAVAP